MCLRPLFALSNQAGIAAAGRINPQPTQGNGEAVPHADQEVDMRESPGPPGEPAAHLDPTEIDDRRASADGGQIAGMPVAEIPLRGIAAQPQPDGAGNMQALLLRRGSDAGYGFAAPGADGRCIADHENLRM